MSENNLPIDENLQQDEVLNEKPQEEQVSEEVSEEQVSSQDAAAENEEVEAENPEETTTESESEEAAEETSETEETAVEEPEPIIALKKPYHERYYLKYGEGKRTVPMDLAGTRALLLEMGFDGGELMQARKGKDSAENFKNAEPPSGNQMRCSYCGCEISGVDFQRLPDGRIRCTSCSNSIVKTKAEVEEILQRILDNLDNFFGAIIDVPVSINVLEERKLKKKVGIPLGTQDEQSLLILGVAINKKKKYSILIENGAPRISLIATFAHELTHIWQYTHWDNNKKIKPCPKNKRLLIYEGMAKWVEIQYLYLVGETAAAKREEMFTRNRQDEYGIGFCMFEDAYPLTREAMSCEETPFIADKYPI